jgi:hypothetical protein
MGRCFHRGQFSSGRFDASQLTPRIGSGQAATPLNRAPSDGFADDHVGGAAVLSPLPMQPAQVNDHLATSTGLEVAEEESPVPNQCVPNVYSQPFAGSNFFGGLAIRPSRTLEKRMSLVMLPTTPTSPDRAPAASEIAWS